MRTYYFDTKDGVPVRDRIGLEFASAAAAITHSKQMASKIRREIPLAMSIVTLWSSTNRARKFTGKRSIPPENWADARSGDIRRHRRVPTRADRLLSRVLPPARRSRRRHSRPPAAGK
ncbi:DUF6894 family protein [Bradyrhizobium sp. 13971]